MSIAKEAFLDLPAGTAVFTQGDIGSDVFIVEAGQIELVQPGMDLPVTTLGPGDFLGEAALLDGQPHVVTARAKTASRLLRIERTAFADVVRQNADIALHMLRKVVTRERRTEQRLRDLQGEMAKAGHLPVQSVPARNVVPPPAKVEAAPVHAAPVAVPIPAPTLAAAPAPVKAAAVNLVLRMVAGGQILPLDAARSEWLVGRPDPATGTQPEIDLGPFDLARTLSRRHAKILREGGVYFVREDTATTNGTFVNGERLITGTSVALKPGDKLRFGSIEVELAAA